MRRQNRIAKILSSIFTVGMLVSLPAFAQQGGAQQTQQPAQGTAPASVQPVAPANQTPQQQQQPQQTAPSGTAVNPSQAPLQPVTTYPDANGADQTQQPAGNANPAQANVPEAPQPKRQPSEPVGAATAETVPTAGGAAAKPAGVAIAPAKQHQTRSLLIKVGAALAAGAAVGTVFALSHSSPSVPPGATSPGVTQK
jgi:hypothetical protein